MECTICLKSGTNQQKFEAIKNWLDECGNNFNVCNDKFSYKLVEGNIQVLS
jgi:hypothetical protein